MVIFMQTAGASMDQWIDPIYKVIVLLLFLRLFYAA